MMNNSKVLVALSGGVDSSACVVLLQRAGYEVEAAVLDLFPGAQATVEAAQETAERLGVRLHVVREHDAFHRNVVLPFCEEYRAGRTPNPCILCNPTTKFHFLMKTADELGIGQVATGHYARIERAQIGGADAWLLQRAGFLPRDQSYMLYRLGQSTLSRLILPLHSLAKDEVRRIAAEAGLPAADKPDSQEICFIPEGNYASYIEKLLGPLPGGDLIAPDGSVCGRHKGILHYTVGQRKGLGVALGRPVFVSHIDAAQNRVYLAEAGQEYAGAVELINCVTHPALALAGRSETGSCRVEVKIRSMARPVPAYLTLLESDRARLEFDEPQRAPAPGQSAVCYCGDTVAGGGLIDHSFAGTDDE
ncbi:tRNA 2-thiouridine(34) synthase MnmA [Clostridiaceae bacterium NSJ-31]|uniref:tRNA-specific 2-thiouridylase MnmA n=1 Tax=Ligaoa zhengdingensis TaxID=2763658 RepID=A0A926DV51_9FIRM|nr:tRNA 2-thiouridine(34) synthase MnmA [Ligaoa zhengdingensis]MBC8545860.1 tRNA 2-thiouridine(34) synthase MnmA [Ligaoa zhengdingensis]